MAFVYVVLFVIALFVAWLVRRNRACLIATLALFVIPSALGYLMFKSVPRMDVFRESRLLHQRLEDADHAWGNEERTKAVKAYKALLSEGHSGFLFDELPRLYRRVIEYEADYGDPGEARDWIRKAWDDGWNGKYPCRAMSFESKKATDLWDKVTSKLE